MSGSFPQKRNAWVAIVAAYVLILQAVLGSPMLGAAADPLRVGAFGVICSTTGAGAEADKPGLPQHHLPDCCLNGCLMTGMAALPGMETAPFVGALPARKFGHPARSGCRVVVSAGPFRESSRSPDDRLSLRDAGPGPACMLI